MMGPAAIAISLIVAIAMTVAGFAPIARGAGLLAVLAWFALPGVVLGLRLYGGKPGGAISAVLAGAPWGYVLSSLVMLGMWAAGIRSFPVLMLSPLPAAALVWPAARLRQTLDPPAFNRRDLAAAAFVLLAVMAIVGRPYSRVGIDLPEGRAYRAYFTADFVWAMAVTSEVSKGDVPPKNPYYVDDALHYYWLMHLLPAAEYRSANGGVRIEQVLLANGLWASLMFGAFFYFFVRHFVERPSAAALACVGVLFCSSFEGAERLWWAGASLEQLRSVNIDAVGNWFYQGMKIDGLHRALFWQPQHLVGYLAGFSALLFLVQARDCSRAALLFLVGAFLGVAMLLSSPAAAMMAAVAASYETFRLARAGQWRSFVPCALAGAAPMAGALALSAALQYVDTRSPGNPLVTFGVNRLATHRVWLTIFLNFGPVAIVALPGLAAAVWRGAIGRFVPLFFAVVVSAAFYVFVDVPDHLGVYVAWRASHLIFMALTPLCGFALQEWWTRGGAARWTIAILATAVALAALPTVLIDIYNAQDVANRGDGPGFKWTVVLTPAELEGLTWIKANTQLNARVQIEPYSRNRDAYYVTAFGERRMSGGLPTGLIPLAKYEAVSGRIRELYRSDAARDAYDRALSLCVDYLMIGPPERAAYPRLQPLLDASPHFFLPVFRNEALAIYAVSGSWDAAACRH
jgi:hypothetical protein